MLGRGTAGRQGRRIERDADRKLTGKRTDAIAREYMYARKSARERTSVYDE